MNWQSVSIGVSFALFAVWMERKGRWSLFLAATAGDYQLSGSRGAGSSTTAVSGNTTPAQAPVNAGRTQGSGSNTSGTGPGGGQATVPSGGSAANHNQSPPAPTFG